jgi:hypothetical protein
MRLAQLHAVLTPSMLHGSCSTLSRTCSAAFGFCGNGAASAGAAAEARSSITIATRLPPARCSAWPNARGGAGMTTRLNSRQLAQYQLSGFMCLIQDCDGKPVAKGLCTKHYMRARRTGDPGKTRKPGRAPAAYGALLRSTFAEWSPRTQQRYISAMRNLRDLGAHMEAAIKDATRPNGSVNVSRLANFVDRELIRFLLEARNGPRQG